MSTPAVTLSVAEQLGLLPEEYNQIIEILGRNPNFTELSVYSVMWSEHCSYKNSILQLKTLPSKGEKVLAGAGEEGAGLMDIGHDLAVAFKMESHNHPSAIEPYQGAATGVGGIHRDIFSMGARPIAALDSLRFGALDIPKTRHLIKGVVKGIGDYGNAFGVPTVAGDVTFDSCYNINPLVNAMSVGIVERGKSATATAAGIGNPVFIVGSSTGKDGIHGATFASEDISDESEEKLPSVQVGDPFTEKLLLEATLEALETGVVVGVQDMGAAGITCATSETAAKGNVGMNVWLDKVPMRQDDMVPFEILLSESQERMLFIVEKGNEKPVLDIFEKWDLNCAQIGEVIEEEVLRYHFHGEVVAEVPAQSLVLGGGAPVYTREQKEPAYFEQIRAFDPDQIPVPTHHAKVVEFLLSQPTIASKRWVTEQYDSMVGTANMTTNAPSDAAIVRIKGKEVGLVVTSDCNSRFVYSNPEKGAAHAVSESARNIVCAGGTPLGVTNCLNFGNPYDPEVYFQFAQAIKGMGDACRKFDTPITGGNVSLYNQSETGPIYPTPMIGMVGTIEQPETSSMSMNFKQEGDALYLLGNNVEDIACSEYVYRYHNVSHSPAPYIDLDEELALQKVVLELIGGKLIQSAHDISDGGLVVSLLESSFTSGKGFSIQAPEGMRVDAFLYGEAGGRVVVSVNAEQREAFEAHMAASNVSCLNIGQVAGADAVLDGDSLGTIEGLKEIYDNALENVLFAK
ncbi:phosphoribosylformylglycinamidine synthase subunit PurL [Pontibacter sp. G13]|uniref:phosphoribosylformylglycinamidine synthase subunit PurL n=1 Tax=Pontibacter sp. G13 TaxID=3074898 RepID=UPI00288A62F4|nr:phosphoribosylformylglycinamidine synthase subunit PurL [Pontibacter sp. G13]WNJ21158.1 phosphoribosylformylglycinamidine synthase subunit PurL [Pontibacter sp. G13]